MPKKPHPKIDSALRLRAAHYAGEIAAQSAKSSARLRSAPYEVIALVGDPFARKKRANVPKSGARFEAGVR
jgi:hypothetical protein